MGVGGANASRPGTAFSNYVDKTRKEKEDGTTSNTADGDNGGGHLNRSTSRMSMSSSMGMGRTKQWRPPSVARQTPRMLGNGEVPQPTGQQLKGVNGPSLASTGAALTGKGVGGRSGGGAKSGDLAAAAAALAGAASKLAATVDPAAAAAAAATATATTAKKGGASSLVVGAKGDVKVSKPGTAVPKFKPIPEEFVQASAAAAAAAEQAPPPPSSGGGAKLGGLNVVRPPTAMKDGSAVPASAGPPRMSATGGAGAEILTIAEDEEFYEERGATGGHQRPSPTGMSTRGIYGPGPGTPSFEAAVRAALQSGGRLSSNPGSPDLSIEDRFRQIYEVPGRHSRITPSSKVADLANRFNEAVRRLKEKIYTKGSFAITQHFQGLDSDNSGTLEKGEFMDALKLFNLGDCVTDDVAEMLHRAIDKDNSGSIDYEEFTQALRMGRVNYLPEGEGERRRVGPDPELPFGQPGAVAQGPFAYMKDADTNLEAFDKRINKLYMKLEDSFHLFDKDGSGEVDRQEFLDVMKEMNDKLKLKLSDREISDVFRQADTDGGGTISYQEFVRGFAGAGQRRFIPEFLKPKIARRSAQGNPWDWTAENPNDKFIKKVGSDNTYFAETPNRKNWHPEGGKPLSTDRKDPPDPKAYIMEKEKETKA